MIVFCAALAKTTGDMAIFCEIVFCAAKQIACVEVTGNTRVAAILIHINVIAACFLAGE